MTVFEEGKPMMVCVRVDDENPPMLGCIQVPCSIDGTHNVWVAPSNQQNVAEGLLRPACVVCMGKELEKYKQGTKIWAGTKAMPWDKPC